MPVDFTARKRAILTVVGLLIAADIGLGVYSWQLASAPNTSQKEFDAQNLRLKVVRGDIQQAQNIKDRMPATKSDCDKFEQSLPPQGSIYSSLASELDDLAKKSGLQIVALTTKEKDLTKEKESASQKMVEVGIDATVNGEYGNVAKFVNGLQRSQKFYI